MLLRRLIGPEAITFEHGPVRIDGGGGSLRARIPADQPPEVLCVALGVAVARVAARLMGLDHEHDALPMAAHAVIMPEEATRRVVAMFGPRVHEIARAFVVPIPFAARRLRCLQVPLASGQFLRLAFQSAG